MKSWIIYLGISVVNGIFGFGYGHPFSAFISGACFAIALLDFIEWRLGETS